MHRKVEVQILQVGQNRFYAIKHTGSQDNYFLIIRVSNDQGDINI